MVYFMDFHGELLISAGDGDTLARAVWRGSSYETSCSP